MLPDDSALGSAYTTISEWGPAMRIPRRERLARVFPALAGEEFELVLRQMDDVDKTVWELAQLGAESKLGSQKPIESLQGRHRFLNGDGLPRWVAPFH